MSTVASQHPSDSTAVARTIIIVMGVAGCGKTTVGKALSKALDVPFTDGDDLHSDEALAKMTAGTPLNDADRMPWLDRIGTVLADATTYPKGAIIACSALRWAYRERLRDRSGQDLRFLYLKGTPEMMRKRVASRKGHYMPASLVDSQFAILEPPESEPDVVTMAADARLDLELPHIIKLLQQQ